MKNTLLILSILVIFSSCDDWLDIKPKGKITFEETEDFRLLLDQTDNLLAASSAITEGHRNVIFCSDDIQLPDGYPHYFEELKRNYVWAEVIFLEYQSDPDWATIYSQMYVSNYVISKLEGSSDAEDKKLLAEAKIHRAYNYFILVNTYAKHYNKNSSSTDLGVPLLLKPGLYGDLTRKTVKEVYDQILKDIREAVEIKDFPDVAKENFNHRPSKAVAYGLWARVALYMGDYKTALDKAEESLKLYDFLYDYNELADAQSKDIGSSFFPFNYKNKETLFNKRIQDSPNAFVPSPELLKLYDKKNDLRFLKQYMMEELPPNFTGYVYNIEIYEKQGGIGTAEIYLIRAECNARIGSYKAAMDDVNKIRELRWGKKNEEGEDEKYDPFVPLTASNKEDALKMVKDERRKELAFKGLRWFDLKRYNEHDNANISLTRTYEGKQYRLEAKADRWALPIMEKYLDKK